MRIIFATHSQNKLKQIKKLLPDFEVLGLSDVGITEDIPETSNSYRGNAELKARYVYEKTRQPCLSDDSGLSIDAFDGWPGIQTHRFLGENSTADQRNDLILTKLKGIKNRDCSVICSICFIDQFGTATFKEGIFDAEIALQKKGENKFGFDEIIMYNNKTLAELSDEEKLKINARSMAINKILPIIKESLKNQPVQTKENEVKIQETKICNTEKEIITDNNVKQSVINKPVEPCNKIETKKVTTVVKPNKKEQHEKMVEEKHKLIKGLLSRL